MPPIPIDVDPQEALVHADRRLAFEVITAFRSPESNPVESVRVLERWDDQGTLLAEFSTPVPLPLGIAWTLKTVEYVTFHEPSRIDFALAQPNGILRLLEDRFTLEEVPEGAYFRYESRFGIGGWVLGWILGQLAVKPLMKSHMRAHTAYLKQTIEERARRSRKYPRPESDSSIEATGPSSETAHSRARQRRR